MKDEIFDKYLADILSKKDTGVEKPAAEALKEPQSSSEDLGETARQEELEDFAEKTIRLSSSEAADFSKVKRAPATAPENKPEQKPRKKKVRKANYSAYARFVHLGYNIFVCNRRRPRFFGSRHEQQFLYALY